VLDAGRDQHGVHRFEVGGLDTRPQARVAIDHKIEFVGATVLAPRLLLLRLQAQQLGDEAWPVENIDANRALAQEMPRAAEVDYIHSVSG
jgi:hypothetical protein